MSTTQKSVIGNENVKVVFFHVYCRMQFSSGNVSWDFDITRKQLVNRKVLLIFYADYFYFNYQESLANADKPCVALMAY